MIIDLIESEDILLHKKIEKCSYNLDRKKISKDLKENMIHHEGVGLSANQIGISERVFVMIRDIEYNEVITCFNPKILKYSKQTSIIEEGCLSYSGLYLKIERPDSVVVKYEDEDKNYHKIKLDGFAARVFQHEYDHMEGIDFTERS